MINELMILVALNNPGNIRQGDHWMGMAQEQHSQDFVDFQNKVMGYRAMAKILITYHVEYGISTIQGIVYRYAPSTENDTEAYIEYVCHRTGYTRYKSIDLQNPDNLFAVMRAMSRFEQGENFHDSDAVIKRGIKRAIEDGTK